MRSRKIALTLTRLFVLLGVITITPGVASAAPTDPHADVVTREITFSDCIGGHCVFFWLATEFSDTTGQIRVVSKIECRNGNGTQNCQAVAGLRNTLHEVISPTIDLPVTENSGGTCGTAGHSACPPGRINYSSPWFNDPSGGQGWYGVDEVVTVCYNNTCAFELEPPQRNDAITS